MKARVFITLKPGVLDPQGRAVHQFLELNLPIGRRQLDFSLRPVFNARGQLVGIVPEAVDITARQAAAA